VSFTAVTVTPERQVRRRITRQAEPSPIASSLAVSVKSVDFGLPDECPLNLQQRRKKRTSPDVADGPKADIRSARRRG
jgi:hypothetical protein